MEYYQCFARKNSNKQAMLDVFMRDWYATNPYLYDIGMPNKIVHCSNCGTIGMDLYNIQIYFIILKCDLLQVTGKQTVQRWEWGGKGS